MATSINAIPTLFLKTVSGISCFIFVRGVGGILNRPGGSIRKFLTRPELLNIQWRPRMKSFEYALHIFLSAVVIYTIFILAVYRG